MENFIFVIGLVFITVFFATVTYKNTFFAIVCLQPVLLFVVLLMVEYTAVGGLLFYSMSFVITSVLSIVALWFCAKRNQADMLKCKNMVNKSGSSVDVAQ